jgi:CRP-like cAMP-binding protein
MPASTPDASANTPGFLLDWEQYGHGFKEITVPAKTTLLREGDIARQAYFIKKGCLRLSFNNHGKDITFQFFFENLAVSSFESFRNGRPSIFSIESIEPSTLLVVSKQDFDRFITEIPGYKEYLYEILFQRLEHYAKLFLSRIRDTPRQRYLDLLKEYPQIIQRVPQHYIASYLGITAVSLSRIRKRPIS